MSTSKMIFGKEVLQLMQEDLELFFSQEQEENSVLEFKSGDASLEDIHKEVAAFLNTEGGILIIGAPRETSHPERKHVKICTGSLCPSEKIRNQDTLMRSIATGIFPFPLNIRCKSIPVGTGTVYILEIPQSKNPPHQVTEKGIYYVRLDREARPAPHGLVQALFTKRNLPSLLIGVNGSNDFGDDPIVTLSVLINNHSDIAAEGVGYIVTFEGISKVIEQNGFESLDIERDSANGHKFIQNQIIVKGVPFELTFKIKLTGLYFIVRVKFYSKEFPAVTNTYLIKENGAVIAEHNSADENSPESEEMLAERYLTLTKQQLMGMFSETVEEMPSDQFNEYATVKPLKELGVLLPESYLQFLRLTNGFNGYIGTQRTVLWSSSRLTDKDKLSLDANGYTLAIGNVDMNDIGIKNVNNAFLFGVISKSGSGTIIEFIPVARSFFRLIEKIYQHSGHILSIPRMKKPDLHKNLN
jgi:hypothetical protein